MKKSVNELNPNDVIKIGNDWFRIRYFHYRNLEISIDLQRECDQLSPYCDSTCISISISKELNIKFEAKGAENNQ